MITALLVAIILIAIVCVIASALIKVIPMPYPLPQVIWAVVAVLCLLVLLDLVSGSGYISRSHLLR